MERNLFSRENPVFSEGAAEGMEFIRAYESSTFALSREGRSNTRSLEFRSESHEKDDFSDKIIARNFIVLDE